MVYGGMEKTTLYLPADTQRQLREVARRTGVPQARIVREAIERYVNEEPAPMPASIGMGSDEEVTGANSEKWLRRNWQPE
jgi:predicted transcriptional regulator